MPKADKHKRRRRTITLDEDVFAILEAAKTKLESRFSVPLTWDTFLRRYAARMRDLERGGRS